MARQTVVSLLDDLDGSAADETVSFALDGTSYEIDLTAAHAAELRQSINQWVSAGRRLGLAGKATPPRRHVPTDVDPAAVRAWASSNDIKVSARGRVPASIIEQYRAAGN